MKSDKKYKKGKPKTVINLYHKNCQKMILKNNKQMDETDSKDEKQRLRNLNHSMLQRLKRRRDEEFVKQNKEMQADRLLLLIKSVGSKLSES